MKSNFAAAFGIGIACIAIVVAGVVYMQRGSKVDLSGKVIKVRTAPLDENSAVVVLDFRITNPSDYTFMARNVTVEMEDSSGTRFAGKTSSETDARQLFEALPLLGERFNGTLVMRDKIAPHDSTDRMVAARFETPESKLEARKRFVIRIEEIDGKSFEFFDK
jgi:hypothetical protein